MKPLISVIVPVYNVADYLLKCLKSLSKQNYERFEIILVDDGSTDESGQLCDEYVKHEKRARVYHKKNGGLSDARNYGLKKAKGKLVVFVDSDDYVADGYLSLMEKGMDDGVDIVICGFNNEKIRPTELSGRKATVRLLTKQDNIDIVVWNKLYIKSLFNNIVFPKGEKHEDTLTTYKLLFGARKVKYLEESLYNYVERKNSITQTEDIEQRLMMRERAAKEAIEYFRNDEELKEAAEICLLWAKYNFLNYAIKGKISKKYEKETIMWLNAHAKQYRSNRFLTKKLRIYNVLSTNIGGVLYKTFKLLT